MTGLFGALEAPAPDPIIKLMGAFAADPRPDKIDLGVGVYRDAAGRTPVMAAVAAAEARILAAQDTKGYLGLAGDPAFLSAMAGLLLGAVPERMAAVATPGGSGAIRQLLELVRLARPGATVWISRPNWPNHAAIADALGLRLREHAWLGAAGAVDMDAVLADLGGSGTGAVAGDVVVVHASCHNPSGADMGPEGWAALADLCAERGLVPLVDVAYQGFGEGVAEDVAGLRLMAARLPEVLVAASGSKSFGLYRERVGLALALTDRPAAVAAALASLNRKNYAFPPDHGARVVTTILTDPVLRADWQTELDAMRHRIAANRTALADALAEATGTERFAFLTRQRGMFSVLGLARDQIARLRTEHGVYLVEDGRANLAGLTPATIPATARAIAATV